jgi:[ribosomal protein S5]-alanine N-acetyltransferase
MIGIPTIIGDEIILRKIKESDIVDRIAIGRHSEFVKMCGGEHFEGVQQFDRSTMENWYKAQLNEECAFIIEYQGKCVGGTRFHHISKEDNCATYAVGIFDSTLYSKGIGTKATKLMLKFGFEILKFHRIDLKVLDFNKRGIHCYEKCGFKVDGIMRENAFIEGEYYSDVVMSILDYEYFDVNIGGM